MLTGGGRVNQTDALSRIPFIISPSKVKDMSTSPSPSVAASSASDDSKHVQSPLPSAAKPELAPSEARTPCFPTREDCWSEEASRSLIDAWGAHYIALNRGNLRREHWQEISDAVNAVHAASFKLRRTDVQCKNRVDTIKKKYKIEKSKVVQSSGRYSSTWPHFHSIDSLIGDAFSKTNNHHSNGHNRNFRRRDSLSPEGSSSPPPPPDTMIVPYRRSSPVTIHLRDRDPASGQFPKVPWPVPVGPRSKRSVTERNFSVMAAAAAAMEAKEEYEVDDEDSGAWGSRMRTTRMKRKRPVLEKGTITVEGYRRLAEAIAMLGKIYEKVEEAKQRQMVELEKQRMQFAKDLEIQRMKIFMESQVQLEKLKRVKQNSQSNGYL